MDWYIPSFHGDIRLRSVGNDIDLVTELEMEDATAHELDAVLALRFWALKKPFLNIGRTISSQDEFRDPKPMIASGRTFKAVLHCDPERVARKLARILKPGRMLVSAVTFREGGLEEVWRSESYKGLPALPPPVSTPNPPPAKPYRTEPDEEPEPQPKPKEKTAVVTIAAPEIGCPAPNFDPAEARARRVLSKFTTPEQMDDYVRLGRFVSVGAETGRRYMLTSRESPAIRKYVRSVYDLDLDIPICTHDWTVPAAEELLALHVMISLTGWESWVTRIHGKN